MNTGNIALDNSYISAMAKRIHYFSKGRLSDSEIHYLAVCTVNRMDFTESQRIKKEISDFAKKAVTDYIHMITA